MSNLFKVEDGHVDQFAPTPSDFSTAFRGGIIPQAVSDAAFVSAKGSAAAEGDCYWNTVDKAFRCFDGTAWSYWPALTPKEEQLTIATQDVIPELAETPFNNFVTLFVAGHHPIYNVDYTVIGTTVTWVYASAGYHLNPGDEVVAMYQYGDANGVSANIISSDATYNLSSSGELAALFVALRGKAIAATITINLADGVYVPPYRDW